MSHVVPDFWYPTTKKTGGPTGGPGPAPGPASSPRALASSLLRAEISAFLAAIARLSVLPVLDLTVLTASPTNAFAPRNVLEIFSRGTFKAPRPYWSAAGAAASRSR